VDIGLGAKITAMVGEEKVWGGGDFWRFNGDLRLMISQFRLPIADFLLPIWGWLMGAG
jgi:hypothetical protein